MHELDAIKAARASGADDEEVQRRESEWNNRVNGLVKSRKAEFNLLRDNLHLFHQDPAVLNWDRRELEPLVVRDDEFFPNAPCALPGHPAQGHATLYCGPRAATRTGPATASSRLCCKA